MKMNCTAFNITNSRYDTSFTYWFYVILVNVESMYI